MIEKIISGIRLAEKTVVADLQKIVVPTGRGLGHDGSAIGRCAAELENALASGNPVDGEHAATIA